jgi:tetratricopeptide (TPR) repeat protein
MASYSRIRRQQVLREAEGYLDLATVMSEQWPLTTAARDRVCRRALDTLARLEGNDAEHYRALHLKGQALRIMEHYQQAVHPLKKALQHERDNIHIYLALGWCYKRLGKIDLAIQALEHALDIERDEGIIHYNLACYWSLANNVALALVHLSQAIDIDTSYRERVAEEPDFDPVRNHPEFVALTSVVV